MRKELLITVVLFSITATGPVTALTWTTKASAPAPGRCQIQAHGNVRDTIYLCGGRASGAVAMRTVHAYVPETDTWLLTMPDMPGPRSHGCGDVIDTIIYAAGGFDSSATPQTTLYAFNANTKNWSTAASMPSAVFLTSGAAYGGNFYVFGSQNNGDTLFEYRPNFDDWRIRLPSPRPPGRRIPAAAGTENYLYIMGGIDSGNQVLQDCWRYQRQTGGVWTQMADMPGPRCMHAAFAVEGDSVIYVVGGNPNGMGQTCDALVYKYTIATNIWTTDTPMISPRGFLILDGVSDKIYAICGLYTSSNLTTNEEGSFVIGSTETKRDGQYLDFSIYPNPSQGQTTISYRLDAASKVTLEIYNSYGALVKVLVNRIEQSGVKNIQYNSSELGCGVFFVKIEADAGIKTDKLVQLK